MNVNKKKPCDLCKICKIKSVIKKNGCLWVETKNFKFAIQEQDWGENAETLYGLFGDTVSVAKDGIWYKVLKGDLDDNKQKQTTSK